MGGRCGEIGITRNFFIKYNQKVGILVGEKLRVIRDIFKVLFDKLENH